MGVWIETLADTRRNTANTVTPYVGVWIETEKHDNISKDDVSHPMWVCGLKLDVILSQGKYALSHPMWVCGLKLAVYVDICIDARVTPYVGVDIIFDVILCLREYCFYKSNNVIYCTIFIVR